MRQAVLIDNVLLILLAWLSAIPHVLWPKVQSFEVVRRNPRVPYVPFIPFIRGPFINGENGEGLSCDNPGPPLSPRCSSCCERAGHRVLAHRQARVGAVARGAGGGLRAKRRRQDVVHRAASAVRRRSASRPARCRSVELPG